MIVLTQASVRREPDGLTGIRLRTRGLTPPRSPKRFILGRKVFYPFISLSIARAPSPSMIVSTPATRNV